jgi:hypothetical protein
MIAKEVVLIVKKSRGEVALGQYVTNYVFRIHLTPQSGG